MRPIRREWDRPDAVDGAGADRRDHPRGGHGRLCQELPEFRAGIKDPDGAGVRDRIPIRVHFVQISSLERAATLSRAFRIISVSILHLGKGVVETVEAELGVEKMQARIWPA